MGSDHLYPLTSLQIGEVKANLSRAFLYFAPESHKFLILVDNQSWRKSEHSISTLIKEFVTITYRTSLFRNSRPLLRSSRSSSHETKTESMLKWSRILNMASWKEKTQFSMANLHEALHGFIVFEVSWKHVRGIKYSNELQTDTSLALEVKLLTTWEFDGIDQALSYVSFWFSATLSETQTLRTNLIRLQERVLSHSAQKITGSSNDLLLNDKSQEDELVSEDEFFDANETSFDENDTIYTDHQLEEKNVEAENQIGPMGYVDIFLLCRSNDKDLQFELQQIFTRDPKLLTLHESSLPSWAIFLQSYPLFCALYRPWMRPLYETIYVLVSLVTVIIGFYDLYKNIPLLKATVSHLCGPLFNWIESWDMISRIKYLGTMLFIQNLGKAANVFLSIMGAIKLLVSLITKTLMYPVQEMVDYLMPVWTFFAATAKKLCNTGSVMAESFRSMVDVRLDFLIPPLGVYSYLSSLASWLNPILRSIREIFVFVTKGCLLLANYVGALFYGIYEVLEICFQFVASNISHQLSYFAHLNPYSPELSFRHSLWKDLFSRVFCSVRSIIRVLSAFIGSCKRHRLSIHNRLRAILRRLGFYSPKFSCHYSHESETAGSHIKIDAKECEDCKRVQL